MVNKNKIAAAVIAVLQYVGDEKKHSVAPPVLCHVTGASQRLWAVNGRQEQMHMRTLMQMRVFRR